MKINGLKKYRAALIIFFLITIALISGLILLRRCNEKQNQVCFNGNCFLVELALTSKEQKRGLMFRENLAPNKGMLFIFSGEEKYPFWMKNTLIPLDIIWLNKNKEIVFISKNTQPCLSDACSIIEPAQKARYVLELNGGTASRIRLNLGDKAIF